MLPGISDPSTLKTFAGLGLPLALRPLPAHPGRHARVPRHPGQ
jgi:hypothetical protein